MTFLAYIDPRPGAMPVGAGATKSEALAEALLTLGYLRVEANGIVFQKVELTTEEESLLADAIRRAREKVT